MPTEGFTGQYSLKLSIQMNGISIFSINFAFKNMYMNTCAKKKEIATLVSRWVDNNSVIMLA